MKRGLWIAAGVLVVALLYRVMSGGDEAAESAEAPTEAAVADAPDRQPPRAGDPMRPALLVSPATSVESESMHLQGRVVERSRRTGIRGAELVFEGEGGAHTVHSRDEGMFHFEPPAPGSYRLATIAAEGHVTFAPAWGQSPIVFTAMPGRRIEGVTLSLDKVPRLMGIVTTEDGEPAQGATITTRAPAARGALIPHGSTYTSDASGRFELAEPVGTLLEASHPEHGAATRPIMPFDLHAGEIRLELRGVAGGDWLPIAGHVVDEHDAPVADAQVLAFRARGAPWGDPWFWAVTDGDGAFEIDASVGAGIPYTLLATAPERVSAEKHPVEAGTTGVVLRMRAGGGRIAGEVRAADGRPAAGFALLVSQPLGAIEERSILTQSFYTADGGFELGPFEPGEYHLRAVADGHAMTERRAVQVREGETSEVSIRITEGGQIIGQVVGADAGEPIAGATVRVERGPADATLPVAIDRSATTGPDGRFEIAGVPAGRASVEASAPGYNTRIASGLSIGDGATTGPLTIELSTHAEGEMPAFETEGIGASLSPYEDVLLIGYVVEGGGAEEAGLAVGDQIVAVDGLPLSELDMLAAIQLMRGPTGTTVTLRIRDAEGDERDVEVTRRRISL
jgi:hypothetical protein